MVLASLTEVTALRLQCGCGASISYPLKHSQGVQHKIRLYRCPNCGDNPLSGPTNSWRETAAVLSETIQLITRATQEDQNVEVILEIGSFRGIDLVDPVELA